MAKADEGHRVPAVIDVVLKPTRDRSVRRRHPWILSGAVDRIDGAAEPGVWVQVLSADGERLGFGHLSPESSLRVRMLSFGKDPAGDDLIVERISVLRAAVLSGSRAPGDRVGG